ncbi:hypothetical protein [Helicobacter canadensis]|uniref:LPS export ABC transporter periplasmic protein LptC n=1 Tax=Helicobacter canadensis MIT 98-5491 TaxID=537970 RepID=C5ZVW4_9HELI|nr:hypothetical protein [Helicobacter canadensis]EES89045.1 hypothetical protein HCAN_0327 [Helicobacter canadensis MIT 98-5491]EFR49416.1 hypothetical protein HCMG_01590 [Helicobacter canadensis MIT 98-5491]STO99075.1 Uncharacterised protein [Helicobacter canadensis]
MKFSKLKSQQKILSKPKSGRIVTGFFICLSLFSIAMVFALNKQQEAKKQALANISRFEAFDFEYYKISSLGVETYAIGKNVKETSKESGILEQISVNHYLFEEQKSELLQSSLAFFNSQEIFFPKGVNYTRDTIKFWSQEANYSIPTKEILGKGDFVVFNENYNIRGKNILYKNGKVYADNIHGTLTTDKK